MASLADALDAFLARAAPAAGYTHAAISGYRALCGPVHAPPREPDTASDETGSGAASPGEILLLAGEDGAVYVPRGGGDRAAAGGSAAGATAEAGTLAPALQARRFRLTTSTLALRVPAELGGGARVFTLWASPQYLAAAGAPEALWK